MFSQVLGRHLGVAMDPLIRITHLLDLPGFADTIPYGTGRLGGFVIGHILPFQGRNLNVKVNAVQKRPRNLAQVLVDLMRRTGAFPGRIGVVAAGTFLRCLSVVSN